jgi:hypothetical protein
VLRAMGVHATATPGARTDRASIEGEHFLAFAENIRFLLSKEKIDFFLHPHTGPMLKRIRFSR